MKILTGVCLIFLFLLPSSRRVILHTSGFLTVTAVHLPQVPGRDIPTTVPAVDTLPSPRVMEWWEETSPEVCMPGRISGYISRQSNVLPGLTEFRNTIYRPCRSFLKMQAPRLRSTDPGAKSRRDSDKNHNVLYTSSFWEISAIPKAYYVFTLKRIIV